MDKLKYIKLENEDGSYSNSIPLSVDADHVEILSETGTSNLADYIDKNDIALSNLEKATTRNTSSIEGLASGSPKGTYATTAALIAANPDTGVYIVTADGHVYSWTKNGSSAIDLGVYQASDVGDNSVNVNKIGARIKSEDYITFTADDLLWRFGTIYAGAITNNATTIISSNSFRVDKGFSITFTDANSTARITFYDTEGNYVRDTGTYKHINSWTATEDGFVAISYSIDNISLSDGNSTNIVFTGYKKNNYSSQLLKNTKTEYGTRATGNNGRYQTSNYDNVITRVHSEPILLGKNSKIKFLDHTNTYGYIIDFLDNHGCLFTEGSGEGPISPTGNYKDWTHYRKNPDYIVEKDMFLNLRICINVGRTGSSDFNFTETELNKILWNLIEIEYQEPKNNRLGLYDSSHGIRGYIGNDRDFDIIGQSTGELWIDFKKNESQAGLILQYQGFNINIETINYDRLEALFPNNVKTVNDIPYFFLKAYTGLYYNLETEELEILDWKVPTENRLTILINAYGNVVDGLLLRLWIKKRATTAPKTSEEAIRTQSNLIKGLTNSIFSTKESILSNLVRKTLAGETRLFYNSTTRLAINYPSMIPSNMFIIPQEGFKVSVSRWKKPEVAGTDNFISETGWTTAPVWMPKIYYYSILIAKDDDPTILPEEAADAFELYYMDDHNLDLYMKILCYIGNYKDIFITRNGDGSLTVDLYGSLILKRSPYATDVDSSFAQLVEDIGADKAVISEDETHITITLPQQTCLAYNCILEKWQVIGLAISKQGCYYIVLKNGYANPDGRLFELSIAKQVEQMKNEGIEDTFNSSLYIDTVDWRIKTEAFSKLLKETDKIETFLFFTDPHYMGAGESTSFEANMKKHIGTIEKYYNSTPMNFLVCGGDWLNNNDTKDHACFKLGWIDGFMHDKFKKYYSVIGNHDTNYQGIDTTGSEARTGRLDVNTLRNLWYRDYDNLYYSFNSINSRNYVLDTGIDWVVNMDEYKWSQLDWLCKDLIQNNPEHASIFMHIVYNSDPNNITPLAQNLGLVIEAYNNHTALTLNEVVYDFTSITGHIDFVMAGHIHADANITLGGVPCILTLNSGKTSSYPSFDMVLVDYDAHKLKCIRVGYGEDREFDI